jgi:hypothetical protein
LNGALGLRWYDDVDLMEPQSTLRPAVPENPRRLHELEDETHKLLASHTMRSCYMTLDSMGIRRNSDHERCHLRLSQ